MRETGPAIEVEIVLVIAVEIVGAKAVTALEIEVARVATVPEPRGPEPKDLRLPTAPKGAAPSRLATEPAQEPEPALATGPEEAITAAA